MNPKLKILTCWLLMTAILFLLSGCATWSHTDKALLAASWGAAFADWKTTTRVLDDGGSEMNPLVTDHPSDSTLLTYIVVSQLGVTILAHCMPKYRTWILGGATAVHLGCAVHNYGEIE